MRKLNISPPRLVFMAGVALLCACHKSENEQIFDKLDRVIAKKHLYEERFVRHADSLRRELRAAGDDTLRWQTANRLFDSYITYNIDTAARYAGLMHNYADATGSREMKFLSTTCDVSVLIARNNIEEATNGSFPSIRSASPGLAPSTTGAPGRPFAIAVIAARAGWTSAAAQKHSNQCTTMRENGQT